MMRRLILSVALAAAASAAPAQQAETLADIKQDMSVLFVELQKLKRELSTTGNSGVTAAGGPLDRLNAIEAELQRMTSRVEELGFRIETVVEDGTRRLGDLDFRVCEIEPGCDIGSLGDTPRLGGNATAGGSSVPAGQPSIGTITPPAGGAIQPSTGGGATAALPAEGELAVSEEADFKAAQAALDSGDNAGAAEAFRTFRETYPQGPLEAAALVGEGRALEGQGNTREAARRYLSAYSDYPQSRSAAEALWRLGTSLAALGSTNEACVTLSEVASSYPQSEFVQNAADSRAQLGCQ